MKFISIGVCTALLIASLIFSPTNQSDVKTGEGKGKSLELVDVNEFIDFLMFVTGEEEYSELSAVKSDSDGFSNMSVNSSSNNDSESRTQTVITKFKSGTVHEETVVSQRVHQNNTYYSMSLNRNLSIYISETAVYYHSQGNMTTEEDGSTTHYIFDIEIYNDINNCFVKFNRFDYTGDYKEIGIKVLDSGIGIWLDFSENMPEMNDLLEDTYIGEIADEISGIDESYFDQNGDVYLADFVAHGDFSEYDTAYLEIDISNGKKPSAVFVLNRDTDDTWYSYSVNEDQLVKFSFENIDNTVVEFDDNIKVQKNLDKFVKLY